MSIAGIHSNRGDDYQLLIALEWIMIMLPSSDYQWIEIDSVIYPALMML